MPHRLVASKSFKFRHRRQRLSGVDAREIRRASAHQATGAHLDPLKEEYLLHAEECEHLASLAKLEFNRRALLASAAMWRKLADDAKPGDGAGPNPNVRDRFFNQKV